MSNRKERASVYANPDVPLYAMSFSRMYPMVD